MTKKQLITLFASSLAIWIFAQGTMALLPVYAVRLGADSGMIGAYMAFAFFAHTVGAILTGWLADRFQRRRAMLIGVAVVGGPIVDHTNYATFFLFAAMLWACQPVLALFLQDKVVIRVPEGTSPLSTSGPTLGGTYFLLLFATTIAFGGGFVAALGRPLLMDHLDFNPSQTSGVVAISGAASLPFPFLLGRLSDRVGRYGLVIFCFIASALGLLILAASETLWHFWLSGILMSGTAISLAIGPALVTDLVPREILGKALSRYGAAPTVGAIVGLLLTGYAIQTLGVVAVFTAAAILTFVAVALVVQIQRTRSVRLLLRS